MTHPRACEPRRSTRERNASVTIDAPARSRTARKRLLERAEALAETHVSVASKARKRLMRRSRASNTTPMSVEPNAREPSTRRPGASQKWPHRVTSNATGPSDRPPKASHRTLTSPHPNAREPSLQRSRAFGQPLSCIGSPRRSAPFDASERAYDERAHPRRAPARVKERAVRVTNASGASSTGARASFPPLAMLPTADGHARDALQLTQREGACERTCLVALRS
jgi:hypothetical protein